MEDDWQTRKEERKNRFLDRFTEDNPYALELLKGHLLIEEVLEELIASACRDATPFYEARIGFSAKVKLAQAIDGQKSPVWRCMEKLNIARNELAHGRDQSVLESKIDSFIDCAREGYKGTSWNEDRAFNLSLAIVIVHAAISRIAVDYADA